jgi:hypothetical protein
MNYARKTKTIKGDGETRTSEGASSGASDLGTNSDQQDLLKTRGGPGDKGIFDAILNTLSQLDPSDWFESAKGAAEDQVLDEAYEAERTKGVGSTTRKYSKDGFDQGSIHIATPANAVSDYDISSQVNDHLSLTTSFMALRAQHPDWTTEALWKEALQVDCMPDGVWGELNACVESNTPQDTPHIASVESDHTKTQPLGPNLTRYAVILGNWDYKSATGKEHPYEDLPGAERDFNAMKSTYSGEGFTVLDDSNLTGCELQSAVSTKLSSLAYQASEVTLYYVGHGASAGLVGTNVNRSRADGTCDWFNFAAGAMDLANHGVDVTVISDCCVSGGLQDAMLDLTDETYDTWNDLDTESAYGDETYTGAIADYLNESTGGNQDSESIQENLQMNWEMRTGHAGSRKGVDQGKRLDRHGKIQ